MYTPQQLGRTADSLDTSTTTTKPEPGLVGVLVDDNHEEPGCHDHNRHNQVGEIVLCARCFRTDLSTPGPRAEISRLMAIGFDLLARRRAEASGTSVPSQMRWSQLCDLEMLAANFGHPSAPVRSAAASLYEIIYDYIGLRIVGVVARRTDGELPDELKATQRDVDLRTRARLAALTRLGGSNLVASSVRQALTAFAA